MSKLFIISSIGDTDLAKETIKRLRASGYSQPISLLPLTDVANHRMADLMTDSTVTLHNLNEMIHTSATPAYLSAEHISIINDFIEARHIDMAYVGVPSPLDEDIPFQIAEGLNIPFVVAFEFMFKAEDHSLWSHVERLAAKERGTFAVPLPRAVLDIKEIAPHARVLLTGHVSIDKAMSTAPINPAETKSKLHISDEQKFIFASGTTQPHPIDNQFLDALLAELATGKHPTLQIRFGIHPSMKDMQIYLTMLLETCRKYPATSEQFKIILPSTIKSKLADPTAFNDNPFFLHEDVSGPMAANAADNIAQAVPGALLNEAAVIGKPVYFHGKATPYLPQRLFAENLSTFFAASARGKCTRTELELPDDAPDAPTSMARIMSGG